MKKVILLAPLLLTISLSLTAEAKSKKSAPKATNAKLGTSFKFDGTALRGKHQSSLSTRATVENDKLLEDLLEGRMHFTDKLQQDQKRN